MFFKSINRPYSSPSRLPPLAKLQQLYLILCGNLGGTSSRAVLQQNKGLPNTDMMAFPLWLWCAGTCLSRPPEGSGSQQSLAVAPHESPRVFIMEALEAHERDCPFTMRVCGFPSVCNEEVLGSELEVHEKDYEAMAVMKRMQLVMKDLIQEQMGNMKLYTMYEKYKIYGTTNSLWESRTWELPQDLYIGSIQGIIE